MFKFDAPTDEKALFRIGQKVSCLFHPNKEFKVSGKDWEMNGAILYTIVGTAPSWRGLPLTVSGVRQKHLNKV